MTGCSALNRRHGVAAVATAAAAAVDGAAEEMAGEGEGEGEGVSALASAEEARRCREVLVEQQATLAFLEAERLADVDVRALAADIARLQQQLAQWEGQAGKADAAARAEVAPSRGGDGAADVVAVAAGEGAVEEAAAAAEEEEATVAASTALEEAAGAE
eukprot:COSAG01_NODE_24226_length_786_cov_0.975255_1_plen_159_part_01